MTTSLVFVFSSGIQHSSDNFKDIHECMDGSKTTITQYNIRYNITQ